MKNGTSVKTKLRQSFWLLVACFCVVFSGAIKKVIQIHADQKIGLIIHIVNNATRPSQNIKDGHRERHEVQQLVLTEHKRPGRPGFDPLFHLSATHPFTWCPDCSKSFSTTANSVNFRHCASGSVPAYLFIHRWQV